MKAHFSKFALSYFIGALFCLLQVLISFNALGAGLTHEQQAAMTRFDWLEFLSRVGVSCLPVIIAFLNTTVASDKAKPSAPLA